MGVTFLKINNLGYNVAFLRHRTFQQKKILDTLTIFSRLGGLRYLEAFLSHLSSSQPLVHGVVISANVYVTSFLISLY